MNLIKTATALTLGAILSTAALAQADTGFERRDAVNVQRIEQGIRTGQLTPREAARLQRKQARIERMEAQARRDGHISRDERQRIELAQNELSRQIHFEKHDGQVRR